MLLVEVVVVCVGGWVVWYMCWGWGVSVAREQLRKRENRKGNEHEKGDNLPIAGFKPTISCL